MPLIPLHISAAVKLLCLCSVYQIRHDVSIYKLNPPPQPSDEKPKRRIFIFCLLSVHLNSELTRFEFYVPSASTSESASIALKNLFAMVFPFELFLQAVRCRRHAYIIAHVRYIVKPKTGNICEKFLNRCVKLLRFHIVLNFHCCSFNAFFKPNSGIAIPAAV